MKQKTVCRVLALYTYRSENLSSLSFEVGALIDVFDQMDSGWWGGWYNGRRGWFPSSYVKLIECFKGKSDWIIQTTEDGSEEYYYNTKTHEMKCVGSRIEFPRAEEEYEDKLNHWTYKKNLSDGFIDPKIICSSPCYPMAAMVAQTAQTLKECARTGSNPSKSQVEECLRLLLTDRGTNSNQLYTLRYQLLSAADKKVPSSEVASYFSEWAIEILKNSKDTDRRSSSSGATPWFLKADVSELLLEEGSVKGGTLLGFVERLTQHDHLELLDALFKRYQIIPPESLKAQELKLWKEKKQVLVQIRVLKVIKSWLETHFHEEQDRSFLPTLYQFVREVVSGSAPFRAAQLENVIRKRIFSQDISQLRIMRLNIKADSLPEPILPKSLKRIQLLDLNPLELARQMTLLDFRLYSCIKAEECLDKNWRKPASNATTYVKALIDHTNQVTSWVTDSILAHDEPKKRAAILKHWINISEQCRLLNNFNACMAIISALDNSSIGRLKRTWEYISIRSASSLQHVRQILSASLNFSAYREMIQKVNPPCIPFMGIYLQDLTFIGDGNRNLLKSSGWINFSKRMKAANVILDLQQYQSCHYLLIAVPDIQEFIKTHLQSSRDEEELYRLSLKIEPRECNEDTIARRLKEVGL